MELNENLSLGDMAGMGEISLPTETSVGSGDIPAGRGDAEEEYKKKRNKKKQREMKNIISFESFESAAIIESKFDGIADLVKSLHFEMDPKTAEEKKIELGKRQGEVTKRKQIEGGEYSLRRFRKEIKYDETGEDLGVFKPGSYMAATSILGDGPYKKAVKKVRWNRKKYDQWIEDVASNDGWKNAFDMAQNAKHEPGLLQWAKKEFRGEDVMQRIQWDIEAYAESVVNESVAPDKVAAKGRNWDVGTYNHPYFGELIAFRFMASDKMKWHLDMKVSKERQDDFYLSNMGALQGKAYFSGEKYDVKRLAKEMMKVAEKAEDKDPMNFKVKPGGFYEGKKVVLRDYIKALEAWVELRDSMGIKNESLVTEKKTNRDDTIKFIEKYMRFVRTTEEFNGSQGGIWVSGEDGDEYKGATIYDYYTSGKSYELGVNIKWEKELNKRGWYSEWYDAGTVMIWEI